MSARRRPPPEPCKHAPGQARAQACTHHCTLMHAWMHARLAHTNPRNARVQHVAGWAGDAYPVEAAV